MNIKKRLCLIALCFMMLYAFSICAQAKPSKAKVRRAYEAYVENLDIPGKAYYLDMNRDGVEELFYRRYDWVKESWNIYTYRKGKIRQVKPVDRNFTFTVAGYIRYNLRKKRIFATYAGATGSISTEYKLSKNKLVPVSDFRIESLAGIEYRYYRNKKMISQEKYMKKIKKYENWDHLGWDY